MDQHNPVWDWADLDLALSFVRAGLSPSLSLCPSLSLSLSLYIYIYIQIDINILFYILYIYFFFFKTAIISVVLSLSWCLLLAFIAPKERHPRKKWHQISGLPQCISILSVIITPKSWLYEALGFNFIFPAEIIESSDELSSILTAPFILISQPLGSSSLGELGPSNPGFFASSLMPSYLYAYF